VRLVVAATITALLLLGLAGNGAAVFAVRGQLRAETSRLDNDLAARRQAQTQARDELQTRFRQADLPGKLQLVRTRDEAAADALIAWGTSGQPLSALKTVRQARNACAEAVIDYDATAARFPSEMLTGLPVRIDLNDDTTDCGR
jgi:nitrate/nitrite-specific signal transduction histidine kinase